MRGLIFILLLGVACSEAPIPYNEVMDKCVASPISFRVGDAEWKRVDNKCLIGAGLPEFTTTTIEGKLIDDKYFESKVNIINFWFETCPPCVAEMPIFNMLKQKYGTE